MTSVLIAKLVYLIFADIFFFLPAFVGRQARQNLKA